MRGQAETTNGVRPVWLVRPPRAALAACQSAVDTEALSLAQTSGYMSSVIKKRRRKISRHKYRKRLKRERHKRK
jgi:hypothetical protein